MIINFNTGARVGLEQILFEVMEDVEVIELCAVVFEPDINCPIHFSFNIHFHTADGTAGKMYSLPIQRYNPLSLLLFTVEGMDYGALDVDLMFEECMRRKCVNVTIVDNQLNETNETFTFHLSRTTDLSPHIILGPVNGRSYLIDDDDDDDDDDDGELYEHLQLCCICNVQ